MRCGPFVKNVTHSGFGLVIGPVELLKLITIKNYSAVTDSHALQLIITRAKSSQFVFTSRCLATALNNADFSASVCNGCCSRWMAASSQLTYILNSKLTTT